MTYKIRDVGAATALAGCLTVAAAQPPTVTAQADLGLVSAAIEVPVAQPVLRTKEGQVQPVTWRVYEENTELLITLRFTNESQVPLWISQSKVEKPSQSASLETIQSLSL